MFINNEDSSQKFFIPGHNSIHEGHLHRPQVTSPCSPEQRAPMYLSSMVTLLEMAHMQTKSELTFCSALLYKS